MNDQDALLKSDFSANPPPYDGPPMPVVPQMVPRWQQPPIQNQPAVAISTNVNTSLQLAPGANQIDMGNHNVGPKRMNTFCQNCQSSIKTETKTTHKCCTHCCCLFMFLTGILFPCCCIPYCIASPETVVHTCPNCKALIGTFYG